MPSNGIRSPYGFTTGAIPFSLIVAAFISPAMATNTDSPIPDLFGQWGRDMLFFEPPPSGPGPVSRARHKSDGSVVVEDLCCTIAPQLFLGDHNNPILKPEAEKPSGSSAS